MYLSNYASLGVAVATSLNLGTYHAKS
jgi:hypothetical protein